MIGQVAGRLTSREIDRVEVATAGGVSYELSVPLSTYEALPVPGQSVSLFTHLVVRDDEWALYGFATDLERRVFRRLLSATGVGPSLALGMLSRFAAERLVRAIQQRDVATLQTVPRVGRKKAQQLVLDLADKLDDLLVGGAPGRPSEPAADDAMRALVSLGYTQGDAERAVHAVLKSVDRVPEAPELIRLALSRVGKG